MVDLLTKQKVTRSFPEARKFLQAEIVGPDYPAKHLIEQARNKGHITKGKPGRGGGIVTSRDMADASSRHPSRRYPPDCN